MKKVVIITLSYNHLDEATKPYFESIYKYTNEELFDLVWVDNGSTDGTVQFLQEMEQKHNNLHVIYNNENLGYSKGNNCGLKYVQDKDYEFIGLLNNDILFTPNWLEDLIKGFELDKTLGMMSPRENKKGKGVNVSNYLEKYPKIIKRFKNPIKYVVTTFFSCTIMKKEVFDKVGFMDEAFTPAWWEDNDYCFRAMYAGFSLAYNNRVFILHNHSTTSKSSSWKELFKRNEQYFFKKHPVAKYIWAHRRTNLLKDIKKYIMESFE